MLTSLRRSTTGLALLALATSPALAQQPAADGIVVQPSEYGVAETLDRLEAALKEKGIGIAARIDHAENAAMVDMELSPTELLVFGNPKLGTPLMQENVLVGLDLPMKVLAYEDADGAVHVAYTAPETLAERYGLTEAEVVEAMADALKGLTDGARGAAK